MKSTNSHSDFFCKTQNFSNYLKTLSPRNFENYKSCCWKTFCSYSKSCSCWHCYCQSPWNVSPVFRAATNLEIFKVQTESQQMEYHMTEINFLISVAWAERELLHSTSLSLAMGRPHLYGRNSTSFRPR